MGHPDMADVQIVGVLDALYFGEELMAWVVPRGAPISIRDDRRGILPRQDRPPQGPALRTLRRCVPDDGYRQGAEVQAAGAGDQRSRSGPGAERLASNSPAVSAGWAAH